MTREENRYRARKSAGLCVYAGCTTPPKEGCRACPEHLAYYNRNNVRKRKKTRKVLQEKKDRQRAIVEAMCRVGELVCAREEMKDRGASDSDIRTVNTAISLAVIYARTLTHIVS